MFPPVLAVVSPRELDSGPKSFLTLIAPKKLFEWLAILFAMEVPLVA